MFAILEAAGWPIWLLVAASVVALAIIAERLFALRASVIAPSDLLEQVIAEYRRSGATQQLITQLAEGAPLAQIFAAGLRNAHSSTAVLKEALDDTGRAVMHELERFLAALGTIASVSPLLGLLGTVVGMIEIFGAQSPAQGGGNPVMLAHGISIALYNTAYGLIVAIPSLIFYRYFRAKVDNIVLDMERQALRLVEVVHGQRNS